MKKIIIFSLLSAFLFSSQLSLAETYPTSCPTEAQAVIKAVGGCSALDCKIYSNVCAKCCVKVVAPVKTTTTAPVSSPTVAPKPAVVPSTSSGQAQVPNPAPETKTAVSPASSSVSAPMPESSVIEENVLPAQPGFATTTTPKETVVNFVGFIKNVFAGLFRFFGFGK